MVVNSADIPRVNARRTDVFDVFNCRHYEGANPYLNTGAFVFDLSLTNFDRPLPIANYLAVLGDRYPHLRDQVYESHAHLFAQTVAEVNKLEMDLHLDGFNVIPLEKGARIAIECLHGRTTRAVVYSIWDWFEAITQDTPFNIEESIAVCQDLFRQSVYGGPTTYALLRTAREKGIPAFYLWDEGLMQYGYGRKQVRGAATTFDCDSHLDSNFTTYKDDCKAFLDTLGFPVPKGQVVTSLREALNAADRIRYPVAVKPVSGHKGIGVTAGVQDEDELETAYHRAVEAIPENEPIRVIVETSISGKDFRMLCVNGRFVAAVERRPAFVVGDGESTIAQLIDRENRSPARSDTPTSPLGKIKTDEAMQLYLEQQGLSLDSVIEPNHTVYLRKVANLSSGGFSIDATRSIHPDNIVLAQDIAQHLRLTCMGIDVVAKDLAESWKDGHFGIIEINSAPGISMHLKPAIGEPVDVTSAILETFFESSEAARIPIITFNRVFFSELQELIDRILLDHPHWVIGTICQDGVLINRSEKAMHPNYNVNVSNLLRHPKLDLLIAEYPERILEDQGMFYHGSNLVVLDAPTTIERTLMRDVLPGAIVVIREHNTVSIQREGLIEQYEMAEDEPFIRVFMKEIASVLSEDPD
ncbi:cyanophycin synthetase [filamentous cyanobacterium CCP2]|nr:cyanophycin synthetase [filamentous cyanobacterium CCP2]